MLRPMAPTVPGAQLGDDQDHHEVADEDRGRDEDPTLGGRRLGVVGVEDAGLGVAALGTGRECGMDSETVLIVVLLCRPQPTRSGRPRMPCGRTRSSRMRISSAEAYLRSPGAPEHRRQLDDQADDQRADQGAERRTEAAEGDRGEQQQQDLQSGVPAHAVLDDQGVEDPGEAGQRGRRRSTPAGSPCRRRCRRPRPGPGCRTPRGWRGRCGCAGGRSRRAAMTTIEITIAITSNRL